MTQESLFKLSPAEKLQLVEDLWDDLAANPADVPVQDWQITELDRRIADLEKGVFVGSPWSAVRDRIQAPEGN